MAIFRSIKALISQSSRKLSDPSQSRTFFSLSLASASPISSAYSLPSNGYIRRHFLFRSRFLSPVGWPLFLFNPPWKLSQYNIGNSAPRLLNESVSEGFGKGAEVEASGGDDAIRDSYLNLPNFISFGRMLSGPLLGWMIVQDMYSYAFVGLAVSGPTDWLDGYIARKMRINFVVGSYLDPLADKVLIVSVALAMVDKGLLHPGLVGLVVLRDVALIGGATYIRASSLNWKWNSWRDFINLDGAHAQKVEPLFISKVNTVLQLALVAAALLQPGFGSEETRLYIDYLSWLVASTTVASSAAYGVQNWRLHARRIKF
ncbi:hypothetical protein SASPL_146532 [Salvia splendens]|uniref:Cardiolipin synthase n=1 Tax=Salvia splendens TaxID=180675 RepID=A0A8X8WCV4_SALSN|nr:hypothetical protein SASPL_146532 [Salvia splendens]